ncbi:hypothetical protein F5Y19DRAFT_464619 [Xylariaceae sp. FL1651]|nr:hypothetical protein F5Y19DRAFT_464619 [Xylariaceae sp. FL1651]
MEPKDTVVGWQAGPGRRGTLTIIENCLFTIIACTWSIQHPNVPRLDEAWWRTLLRKCKWAIFTLFFPEFIMAHAILEFVMAKEDMKLLDKEGHLDNNPPWFFRYSRQPLASCNDTEAIRGEPSLVSGDVGQQEVKWTLTHCYFANMGGFYIRDDYASPSQPKNHLLTASHFVKYWPHINIPRLSEDDIKDKSKTDYFAKAIAVIQIIQLILSVIFRKAQNLAFSQLETLTLAFAICGGLTYICSWYKPQNVKRPVQVFLHEPSKELTTKMTQRTFDSLWQVLLNSKVIYGRQSVERIPNDNIPTTKANETHYALYVLTVLTAGFGSIHAIAWNFEFPTVTEQLLWRVATLVSTAVPPVALLVIPLAQITVPWGDSRSFRDTCLDVMREYSWHVADNKPVQLSMKTLREACDNPDIGHKHFRDIFGDGLESAEFLGEEILEYVQQNERFRECLPKGFLPKFSQLVEILRGLSSSKRLWEAAETNIYPQRSLFSTFINDGIIYATSIAYCLARLIIIGLAFSSLRRMPDSVYMITWTQYVPSVQ